MSKKIMFVMTLILSVCSFAAADPIEVGMGNNSANLYLEWSDGYIAEFVYYFDATVISGADLLLGVDAAVENLTVDTTDYGTEENPNLFVDWITYGSHSEGAYDPNVADTWWHYWVKDSEGVWESPYDYGMSDSEVSDGDSEGWIFGRSGQPVPEPGIFAIFGVGAVLIRRCKAKSV